MRSPRCHSAFSLLELIIVLVVMAGMMAIVWPNLQRPLSRTTLSEAAQVLRDAIDESRYQATILGVPQFVHLSQGVSQFQTGTFEAFLMNDDGFAGGRANASALPSAQNRAGTALPSGTDSAASFKSWSLPAAVVIAEVSWTLDLPSEISLEGSSNGLAPVGIGSDIPATSPQLNMETLVDQSVGEANSGRQWWLPFLATGQGRDARIELFDASIGQSLTVTYESATGALEISR